VLALHDDREAARPHRLVDRRLLSPITHASLRLVRLRALPTLSLAAVEDDPHRAPIELTL
jgi:hypothetical protein